MTSSHTSSFKAFGLEKGSSGALLFLIILRWGYPVFVTVTIWRQQKPKEMLQDDNHMNKNGTSASSHHSKKRTERRWSKHALSGKFAFRLDHRHVPSMATSGLRTLEKNHKVRTSLHFVPAVRVLFQAKEGWFSCQLHATLCSRWLTIRNKW
jgi:ribosomal protein L28